jgi:predicted patatin/cPLA2 family phospholipase
MKTRDQQYNETLDFLEEMEKEGKAFIIRPKRKSAVGRVEKDKRKLDALYEEGYRDAEECYLELLEYLS